MHRTNVQHVFVRDLPVVDENGQPRTFGVYRQAVGGPDLDGVTDRTRQLLVVGDEDGNEVCVESKGKYFTKRPYMRFTSDDPDAP